MGNSIYASNVDCNPCTVLTVRKEHTQKQKKRNKQLQLQQQEYLTTDRQTRSKEHLKQNEPKQCRIEDVLYFFCKLKGLVKKICFKKTTKDLNDLKCTECPDFFPVIFVFIFVFVWHTKENFIRDRILPAYGNTHTLSTATARQSTFFRFWAAKGWES